MPAAEIILANNPAEVLFSGNPNSILHFVRAIMFKTFNLQHGSEEWTGFVADLTKLTKLEIFEATAGVMESNPAQLAIYSILDLDKILSDGDVPDPENCK